MVQGKQSDQLGQQVYMQLLTTLYNSKLSYVEMLGICSLMQHDIVMNLKNDPEKYDDVATNNKRERPSYLG